MRPRAAHYNAPDCFFGNIEYVAYFYETKSTISNLFDFMNIFFTEFTIPSFFAFWDTVSFFCITHIVELRSKIKMFRVNTFPIIASMKDKYIFRYFSSKYLPRNPMAKKRFSLPSSFRNLTVSVWPPKTFPVPAILCFFYFFKESFLNVYSHKGILAYEHFNCHHREYPGQGNTLLFDI